MKFNTCCLCYKKTKILYKLAQIDNKNICGYCITNNFKKIWTINETKKTKSVFKSIVA